MDGRKPQRLLSAAFASRSQKIVTCPHCWTTQRTERDRCYQCGAIFRYRDEEARPTQAV